MITEENIDPKVEGRSIKRNGHVTLRLFLLGHAITRCHVPATWPRYHATDENGAGVAGSCRALASLQSSNLLLRASQNLTQQLHCHWRQVEKTSYVM